MNPLYNPRCADCRSAQFVASDADTLNAEGRCTNSQVLGYWRGKTGLPLEWVALKLINRDCKLFSKKRKSPVRRQPERRELFGRTHG